MRSRANRRNAPRAPQPTGEEAVRLSRRACAHPPPALLRAHRRSMGAKLMHGGRRLSECAKDKANTLRERAQEAEDRPSTNKASTHSVAAHTVVTLIEATGQSLVCSRHRPGTCRYRRSSRAACRTMPRCALVISVPASIASAMSTGARRGLTHPAARAATPIVCARR